MSFTTLTGQGGVFTRQNLTAINDNFAMLGSGGLVPDVWVRPQYGLDTNVGSYDKPFATLSGCATAMFPGIVIGLRGVLREEYTGPVVNDVTIVGMANQPRQATTSSIPNGGGATWLSPTGGTGSLLTVQGQAWTIQNIYFNNSATGATTADIKLLSLGDPPALADAQHARIIGCQFTGANFGIYTVGEPNQITIAGCTFFNFASGSDTAIARAVGAGVGTLTGWIIEENRFYNNVNHVIAPLWRGTVRRNNFSIVGSTVTTTIALSLTGGNGNSVYENAFNRPLNASPNATLYVGGTDDTWGPNYGATDFFWGVPDNS